MDVLKGRAEEGDVFALAMAGSVASRVPLHLAVFLLGVASTVATRKGVRKLSVSEINMKDVHNYY